jgi:SAM-dependent methyltransferase
MNQILEHTKEVFWIFHEISRVLKKGGKLIIGVPNLASFHNRVLLAVGKQPSSLKNYSAHVRGFTKRDLFSLINEPFPNGYSIRDFGGSNFYPFGPVLAKPLAKLLPTFAWSIFFLFEKNRFYQNEYLNYPTQCSLETNFYLGKGG